MSINIVEELLGYSKDDLRRWEKADYTIIDKRLPDHVRDMLIGKRNNRKSNPETARFFSEVSILNHYAPMIKDGIVWYSSYKWLTKRRWLTGEVEEGCKSHFSADLIKYIGRDNLANLQGRANAFRAKDAGRILGFTKSKEVRYPVAPDIWLVSKDGALKFIEGKHNEKLESTQLVGLALIKKYLDCNVSIIRVYNFVPLPAIMVCPDIPFLTLPCISRSIALRAASSERVINAPPNNTTLTKTIMLPIILLDKLSLSSPIEPESKTCVHDHQSASPGGKLNMKKHQRKQIKNSWKWCTHQ